MGRIGQKNNAAAKQPFMFHYPCFLTFSHGVGLSGLSQNIVFLRKCRNLSQTAARVLFAISSREDLPFVRLKLIVGDGAIRGWIPLVAQSKM
jgi:hypothetical protein